MNQDTSDMKLRTEVRPGDVGSVRQIVTSSGFFRDDEVDVAAELVEERLAKGAESGYEFIFADVDGRTVAYACYGLIPCTLTSYDLYWIATLQEYRDHGLGRKILLEVEKTVASRGGKGIYVETSNMAKYEPTRKFYEKNGYVLKAVFEDFYAEGDDKVVYVKKV
jgi:ribosomal protein S18 acetylase RimI-like enzyme